MAEPVVTLETHDEAAVLIDQAFRQLQEQAEALGVTGFDLKLNWDANPFLRSDYRLSRAWRYGWDKRRVEVFRGRNETTFH